MKDDKISRLFCSYDFSISLKMKGVTSKTSAVLYCNSSARVTTAVPGLAPLFLIM